MATDIPHGSQWKLDQIYKHKSQSAPVGLEYRNSSLALYHEVSVSGIMKYFGCQVLLSN